MRLFWSTKREVEFIAQLLSDITKGFYLEVGAYEPVSASHTTKFYEQGWRGINIEPNPAKRQMFLDTRPEDTVVTCAVGSAEGEETIYLNEGLSTFRTDFAERHRQNRFGAFIPMRTWVRTIDSVLDECSAPVVDFMNLDVEGWESEALKGMTLIKHRPRLMMIESTIPNSDEPCWEEWEPYVLERGYVFHFFNGGNRFYLREEDAWRGER